MTNKNQKKELLKFAQEEMEKAGKTKEEVHEELCRLAKKMHQVK